MSPDAAALPRGPLGDALTRCDAAPLGPSVRSFMEHRFRAEFGDVRVLTGPAAAALCRAVGARAFTLGRDIVFGPGQYDPDRPAGRRLLAHELAHVLQQRAVRPRADAPAVPVGRAADPCEAEADRLAAEALAGGRRSAVTPDRAGAVRRAPVLDPGGTPGTSRPTTPAPNQACPSGPTPASGRPRTSPCST